MSLRTESVKAMPAEQRGCMKMSETVLEDQGVDLHVFQENTNHQNTKHRRKKSNALTCVCCRNTQSPAACWSAEPGLKKILCPYFPNKPFILWLVDILSNISLISPLSGDWWIYFQGDAGEVRLHCVLLPNHAGGVRQGNSSRGSCWILKN